VVISFSTDIHTEAALTAVRLVVQGTIGVFVLDGATVRHPEVGQPHSSNVGNILSCTLFVARCARLCAWGASAANEAEWEFAARRLVWVIVFAWGDELRGLAAVT